MAAVVVTAETNRGRRKYMEDYVAVCKYPVKRNLDKSPDKNELIYLGVFDGHGGKEAAKFAQENLLEIIRTRKKFLAHDVTSVKEAIKESFLELQARLLNTRSLWPPNQITGDASTAGTTACIVIILDNHMFVANVGDSTAVLGIKNLNSDGQLQQPMFVAKKITKDHKPIDPIEQTRLHQLGGEVAFSCDGVVRVVWKKSISKHGYKMVYRIPFLNLTRSLGDFWSFNNDTKKYTVSPEPDVFDIPMNLALQKFVVIASDGLWNVMTPNEVVRFIHDYQSKEIVSNANVVNAVIEEALRRWDSKGSLADNITVLVAFLCEERSNDSGLQNPCSSLTKTTAGYSLLAYFANNSALHSSNCYSAHSTLDTSNTSSSGDVHERSSSVRNLSIFRFVNVKRLLDTCVDDNCVLLPSCQKLKFDEDA